MLALTAATCLQSADSQSSHRNVRKRGCFTTRASKPSPEIVTPTAGASFSGGKVLIRMLMGVIVNGAGNGK